MNTIRLMIISYVYFLSPFIQLTYAYNQPPLYLTVFLSEHEELPPFPQCLSFQHINPQAEIVLVPCDIWNDYYYQLFSFDDEQKLQLNFYTYYYYVYQDNQNIAIGNNLLSQEKALFSVPVNDSGEGSLIKLISSYDPSLCLTAVHKEKQSDFHQLILKKCTSEHNPQQEFYWGYYFQAEPCRKDPSLCPSVLGNNQNLFMNLLYLAAS